MGMTASAHLAYGYDLGSVEDFKAEKRSEYGSPKLPWFDQEEDEDDGSEPAGDFAGLAERVLLDSIGFTERYTEDAGSDYFRREREAKARLGVEVGFSGHPDYPGWILVATGSEKSVDWAETMTLDPFVLERTPIDEGWDGKLEAALAALGITPTQGGPCWLVYPSYG